MKNHIRALKKAASEERGQVLILVLMVLLVGALLMGALMGLVGTGITTGTVYENRTSSLYAADAGIQDGIWQVNNATGNSKVPNPNDTNYSLNLNNYLVNVAMHLQDSVPTYRIVATASKGGSPSTAVTAYIQANMGSPIFNKAINATGNITFNAGDASITGDVFSQSGQVIFPGSGSNTLTGDVYAPGGIPSGGKGTITGTVTVNTGSTVSSGVSNGGVTNGTISYTPPTSKMTKLANQVQSDTTIATTGAFLTGPVTLSNRGSSSNPYVYPAVSDLNQSEYYVSGDLNFTNGNYITFNEPVYVSGDVDIQGNPHIVFNYGVYIVGNLTIESNSLQEFGSTLYVGGNFISNGRVQADNAAYIGGALTLTNGAYIYESTTAATSDNKVIVVNGAISMSGGTSLGSTNQIPLIIDLSTSPVNFTLTNGSNVEAYVYAPQAAVSLQGNASITGSVISNTFTLGSGSGSPSVTYFPPPANRPDLAQFTGSGSGSGATAILSYIIGSPNGSTGGTSVTITIASSHNPSIGGNSITFTAAVSPSVATGTVQFTIDSTNFGSPITLSGGSATSSPITNLIVGSHSISAVYSGDSNYANGMASLTQTITGSSSSTSVSSSSNPSPFGSPVTFTAAVSPSIATGSVTFKDGSTTLGTGTVSSGTATYTTSILSTGGHPITAVYSGNTNYAGSTSAALNQNVTGTSSSTSVASSLNPSTYGQSVIFTANVTGTGGTPTGTVTFSDGGTQLSAANLDGSGVATYSISILAAGSHSITAVYSGDSSYASSTSSALTQTVNNPVPTITSISPTYSSVGGSQFTLTVNGTNFVPSSVVKFNGSARTTTFVSSTQLTATILASDLNTAGTFNITVTNPAPVGGTSNGYSLIVNATTDTFTPTSGPMGTIITVSGSGWGKGENITGVTVGGVVATFNLNVNNQHNLSGTITVPSNVGLGPQTIVIIGATSGTQTFTNVFTVTTVTATCNPTAGPIGTIITITGTGWATSDSISGVTIGGTTASNSLSVNGTGNISGTITVPSITIGLKTIVITGVESGAQVFTNAFMVNTITANFNPTSGPHGTIITVTGAGWANSDTVSTVTVGGTAASTTLLVNSNGNLSGTIIVPSTLGTGIKTIVITGITSGAHTFSNAFTVTALTATFTPASGPVGTILTVLGTGWIPSDTITGVTVGVTSATNYTLSVNSSGNLSGIITVPSTATGAQTVIITGNISGAQTLGNAFTVTTATAVFTPNSGQVGTVVTVAGTGWVASDTVSSVTVGGTTASKTLSVNSSGNLSGTITIPSTLGTGIQAIIITGTNSGSQTYNNAFTLTGAAAKLVFTTSAQTNMTAGAASGAMTVQVQDSYGNPVNVITITTINLATTASGTGSFSLSSTTWSNITSLTISTGSNSGSFYYRDTKASSPTITASSTGLTSATQTETIISSSLASITVIPSSPSLGVGSNQTFTAQGYDQYNNPLTATITWSIASGQTAAGSINSSTGVFTSSHTAGTYTAAIVATSGSINGSTSVTITAGALASITISPSNPSVVLGGNQTFTAQGYDQYNNPVSATATWSIANGQTAAGSINSSTGAFTAGTTTGTYNNVIVANSGSINGYATVTVINPTPTITSISPSSKNAGAGQFTMTVTGTNFLTSSTVNFNGSARATTYVSSTQLTATILTSDLTTGGTYNITVTNPAPGGGTSNGNTLTVNNPFPTVTSISPTSAKKNTSFTLTVNGTNFVSTSVVKIGGTPYTTTFVGSGQLTVSLPSGLAKAAYNITVTNPSPSGGTSTQTVTLTITN